MNWFVGLVGMSFIAAFSMIAAGMTLRFGSRDKQLAGARLMKLGAQMMLVFLGLTCVSTLALNVEPIGDRLYITVLMWIVVMILVVSLIRNILKE